MKLDLRRYLAVVAAAAFAAPAVAADDDYFEPSTLNAPAATSGVDPVSYNETTFLGESAAAPSCAAPAASCEEALCRPLSGYINTKPICNPYQGFTFSVDSTFLKPHLGAISAPALGVGLVTPTYDLTFAPRYNLGYEGEYGLGIRASYWSLAQESNGDAGVLGAGITGRTQAETIDLDITQRIVFQKWNFLVGTGLRSVNTQNTLFVDLGGAGATIADSFDGWGPNFLLEANRPIGSTKLSLYGGAKGSLLFGQTAFDAGIPGLLPGSQVIVSNDTVMTTYQLNMGIQWKGDMLFSRAGLEAQMWNQGQVAGLIGLDYGYVGPSTTIGIIF